MRYRDAGVDIDAADRLIEAIKPIARRTRRPGCLNELGGFGALFEIPPGRYREPVLVSGTDGVGTKVKVAAALGRHDTIGIDLVAMCANDVLVHGAEPLFFLDYFATGRLDADVARAVIQGIGRGCEMAGVALVGGETAELPGLYAEGDYDLAGFCVGAVEKSQILDGTRVRPGDVVLGLASSGPHANGYSLIRKILERTGTRLAADFGGRRLGDILLEPTRIYVKSVLALLRELPVSALAHVTGGGLPGNLARVLPKGVRAVIDVASWPRPLIFQWLQTQGRIPMQEMHRTFNCGVGMLVVVRAQDAERATDLLCARGERVWPIGRIEPGEGPAVRIQ